MTQKMLNKSATSISPQLLLLPQYFQFKTLLSSHEFFSLPHSPKMRRDFEILHYQTPAIANLCKGIYKRESINSNMLFIYSTTYKSITFTISPRIEEVLQSVHHQLYL